MSSISDKQPIDWEGPEVERVPFEDLIVLREKVKELGKGPVALIVEALTKDLGEKEIQAITAMAVALVKSGKDVTEFELVREWQGASIVMYFRVRQFEPKLSPGRYEKVLAPELTKEVAAEDKSCGHNSYMSQCNYCRAHGLF
jgi:acyl-CoA hydrolase